MVQTQNSVIIALDAMGGDNAPDAVMHAAELVLQKQTGVSFLIFGNQSKLEPYLQQLPNLREHSTIMHTDSTVSADEKVSSALRQGKNSSMQLAINAVKEGKAHSVVSGGNTGALMAMSKLGFRMLPGIDRPAILSRIPTIRGRSALLDCGANVDCTAEHLFQFAIMGDAYARAVMDVEKPLIGILNVGSEELKGSDVVKQAAEMIRSSSVPLNFYGFVEGTDILSGTVDVVITDGFTGNVALKTMEGTAKMLSHNLRSALERNWMSKLGALLLRNSLIKMSRTMDPRYHNGAMMIGLNGVAVKSHGSADKVAFAQAIGNAIALARNGVNQRIIAEMRAYHDFVHKNENTVETSAAPL